MSDSKDSMSSTKQNILVKFIIGVITGFMIGI